MDALTRDLLHFLIPSNAIQPPPIDSPYPGMIVAGAHKGSDGRSLLT